MFLSLNLTSFRFYKRYGAEHTKKVWQFFLGHSAAIPIFSKYLLMVAFELLKLFQRIEADTIAPNLAPFLQKISPR